MLITIDCEWDGFGSAVNRSGPLISMALVANDGSEFYEVLKFDNLTSWVKNNVIPVLGKEPIPYFDFQTKLRKFLNQFESFELVADWPEDIAKFCEVLIVGPGMRMDTPNFTMAISRVDTVSKTPHNALEDARALMEALLNLKYDAAGLYVEKVEKVRKDFNPKKEYSVDVSDCTEEEKRDVQQAFFDAGILWWEGETHKHFDAKQYSNTQGRGEVVSFLMYSPETHDCNMDAKEFLALVYEH